jgi:hypothetical protein
VGQRRTTAAQTRLIQALTADFAVCRMRADIFQI